jgi:hypothetical protein
VPARKLMASASPVASVIRPMPANSCTRDGKKYQLISVCLHNFVCCNRNRPERRLMEPKKNNHRFAASVLSDTKLVILVHWTRFEARPSV